MYLGIDFGTSGCRACIIDNFNDVLYEIQKTLPAPIQNNKSHHQEPSIWWNGLLTLFEEISSNFDSNLISDICINGTSATVVHCNHQGKPLSPALMYNDLSSIQYLDQIKSLAPPNHVTLSASSALSKMMLLQDQNETSNSFMLNQADWLSNKLCEKFAYSDYNNALKMGYDLTNDCWPSWVTELISETNLPKVLPPGSAIGKLTPSLSKTFGFNNNVTIKLGTTDSIAAFIATGIKNTNHAVTSLGSTLVIKQLSNVKIEDSQYGIYSHKLGRYWLSGGASNSGGKVLAQHFSNDQLTELSQQIDPVKPSGLNYYPLPSIGERFPINDANKKSHINPRPVEDSVFLKGLFEGIANIECLGYQKLSDLGSSYPKLIITCGGGANNPTWQSIRQRQLNTVVQPAAQSQACYGSALLAKNGIDDYL